MDRSTLEALPAVNVEVNGQAAALLVKLMGDLKTDQPLAVLSRALGVLEQAIGAKAKGQRLGVYDPGDGALHGSGDLMALANRSRPPPLPRHRAREDQAGPAQVHLPGRADRAQGEGSGLDPAAADQRPALPVRQQGPRRGGAGRRATSATAWARGTPTPTAAARRAIRRASTRWRSSCRWKSWRRSWARSCSSRASSPRASSGSSPRRTATSASGGRARSRCATSSAPSVRRCAAS